MERKYQIIYIWSFIIVSSIILLLLYTPMGGDLHQSSNNEYSIVNTSVNFGGKISNSPRRSYSQQGGGENKSNVLPTYYKRNAKSVSTNNAGGGTTDNFSNGTYTVNSRSTLSSAQNAVGSTGGGAASTVFGGGKSNTTSSGSSGSYGGGANSPFSNATPSSSSVMQKATSGIDDLSDPGGEDPIGDPLPIGDGLYLLILMVLIYGSFKFKK